LIQPNQKTRKEKTMSNEVATTGGNAMQAMPSFHKNGAVAIAQTRELAESIAAVQMAKAFPRDMRLCLQELKNECMREHLAEVAVYRYSRGGSDITGASIRLAETMARCLGNIDAGWRELETTPEASKCEAFAWDKERNVRHAITFTVSHIRHTRKGDYLLTDPRDIYEKCANEAARRKRACLLAVIPGDYTDEAIKCCEDTLKANVVINNDSLQKLLTAFEPYKVTKEMIEKRIQRDITAVTPAQFLDLRKVYNSLKDGIAKVENFFEVATEAEATKEKPEAKDKLRAKLGLGKKAEEVEAETETEAETPSAE
jgi:hypothetical protein